MQNSLVMTTPYLLLSRIKMKVPMLLTMNSPYFQNRRFNWKMLFNSDQHKPAQEVLFSRKKKVSIHSIISLNNVQEEKASYQKHIGLVLDENSLLNIILTMLASFSAKVFTHYLQSIFEASNKSRRYHLWSTW